MVNKNLFDPSIYTFVMNTLPSYKQKALTQAYLSTLRSYRRYRTAVTMEFVVNNQRRYKGLKPLRKRTWKKLKGS